MSNNETHSWLKIYQNLTLKSSYESWKCTVFNGIFAVVTEKQDGLFCMMRKTVMTSITYPTRTYFLPVREERQWHTQKMPKRISQSNFMHLE